MIAMTTNTWRNISKLANRHMLKTEFTVTLPKNAIPLIITQFHNNVQNTSLAGHGLFKTADSIKETRIGLDKRQKPPSGIVDIIHSK